MARTVLDINGKFYEMEENQAIEILKFGKEKLDCGIYGVYKDGYARALLERHDDEASLKKAVANYEWKGFTVLYNE
jgi:hypothetical protein